MSRRWLVTRIVLLAAAWASGCGPSGSEAPPAETVAAAGSEASWLEDATAAAGLDFVHESGGTGGMHLPEIMGSGAALLDYDGDDDLDLYLVNATSELGTREPSPDAPVNRLYRQGPDGRFEDVTAESGLGDPGYGMGVAVGDYDNDGDEDVYVTNLGPDRLYRNRGDGTFEEVTAAAGVEVGGWSSSAAFCDLDRDGYLDLYVARYVAYDASIRCYDFAGRREYCGPEAFPGQHDVVLKNDGDGTFTDASREAGVAAVAHAGLGVVCEDFDGDGWADVYVANDADPNELWINRRDGTFEDEALLLGAAVNAQGMAEAGMGVLAADLDNDADLDLFMTHLRNEKNTLYRNLGPGIGFEDSTAASGLAPSSMPWTGFGTAAFDADLDGDLDLAVVNGRVVAGDRVEGVELSAPWDAYAEPNLFYENDGDGRFTPVEEGVAAFTEQVEISRGLAVGDVDNDGDVDLLVSGTQGPARLYRNDFPHRGRWLLVDAFDPRLSRRALGAVVTVSASGRSFRRTVHGGASYLSSHDPRAHFGLGEVQQVDEIVVRWPDGLEEVFPGGEPDRAIRLVRGEGRAR